MLAKFSGGVTESHHLVDIINQSDVIEELDGEEKLGQPLLNLTLFRDWGTLEFYALPYFRERTFPGPEGRLGFPLPVDTINPLTPVSTFDDDVFAGVRYSLNDGRDTALLFGVIRDPETGEQLLSLEVDRRLGQHLTLALRGRAFSASSGNLEHFASDDYLELQLSFHY